MSIKSTFPIFFQTEQKYRSLILGMLARKAQGGNSGKNKTSESYSLFMTLKNGLSEMVDRVIEKSPGVSFKTRAPVKSLRQTENGWALTLEQGGTLDADAVILACPASITARLLEPVAPKVSEQLDGIRYVSTATVTTVYKKEGFSHPLDGFGFVVPKAEKRKIMACTWTSSKFPHRTPDDHVMIRCFVGGALQEELAEQSEEALVEMVKKELLEIMGIHEEPLFYRVYHNRKSNVQYHVNHAERIDKTLNELAEFPGMFLAGSAYTGIGIPDCILNGNRTAEAAIKYLI